MSLRFHEIAEHNHRILNPFSAQKLDLIGEICQLSEQTRLLDLACGKGELLSQWAQRYGIIGVGVDISTVFINAAKARAYDLEVSDQITFLVDDAATYPQPFHEFDVVSCLGATWIGNGLIGTLELMQSALKPGGATVIVGEPFWRTPPPDEACEMMGFPRDDFSTLAGTLERIESVGLELVEMVIADEDSWDRYIVSQWQTVYDYLRKNPDDPDAEALKTWNDHNRRAYLTYQRQYMGWGVFVMRSH